VKPRKPSPAPVIPLPSSGPNLPILAVTLEEAAEILHCGRTTMFSLVKDGKVKTVPVGRKRLVAIKELD
jgi:excisionase family DNA binding protein